MLAAKTSLPVLGVPVQSKTLNGLDSLLSIVQMPAGIPVATFAIGCGRCRQRRACSRPASWRSPTQASPPRLPTFRREQTEAVLEQPDPRTA
jgi:5-(carboxyamino)imidazole ribonucleotide mutase